MMLSMILRVHCGGNLNGFDESPTSKGVSQRLWKKLGEDLQRIGGATEPFGLSPLES